MTQQVKNFVKNYINDMDKNYGFDLTKEQQQERLKIIKATITLGNNLEKSSLFSKMKVIYPMSHPNQTLRSMPINFK